jgi:transposase
MAKPYSEDIRNRVIRKRNEGKTVAQIMSELDVKQTFVYDMLKLYVATGSVAPKQANGGRPRSISEEELLQIETLITETPDITLAEIKDTLSLSASISRICDAVNYRIKMPYKKRHSLIRDKTERM